MSDPSRNTPSRLKAIKSSQLERARSSSNDNAGPSRRLRASSGNPRQHSQALSSDDDESVGGVGSRPRRDTADENSGRGNGDRRLRTGSKGANRTPGKSTAGAGAVGGEKGDKISILRERIKLRDRSPNEREPEVFIVGEIEGGTGFVGGGASGVDASGACVKWRLDTGPTWELLGGYAEGQSHVDFPGSSAGAESEAPECVWCHPIDLHLSCKGLAEWPRLLLQVWRMDEHGRLDLAAYAFVHVPTQPGHHSLSVSTWRPMGSLHEEVTAYFLGGTPQLRDVNVLFAKAWSDRCRLSTSSSGTIRINLDVVLRNFQDNQVDI
jgi:B9 domain-containing protein 2